jgi:hypothetical protein
MNMDIMIEALSADAKTALASARGYHCGTVVMAGVATSTLWELEDRGLIGPNGGLTIRGSVVAMKLQNAQLDALFGPE